MLYYVAALGDERTIVPFLNIADLGTPTCQIQVYIIRPTSISTLEQCADLFSISMSHLADPQGSRHSCLWYRHISRCHHAGATAQLLKTCHCKRGYVGSGIGDLEMTSIECCGPYECL